MMNKRRVFLGSKLFGLSMLNAAVSSDPGSNWLILIPNDSSDPRSNSSQFRDFASQIDAEISVVQSGGEATGHIEKFKPESGLVCGWYEKITPEALQMKNGLWGIHNSLLPKYRGGSPLVWALINGETKVGSSIFLLTDELDAGAIAGQVSTRVKGSDSIETILKRLQVEMGTLVGELWPKLANGERVQLTKQDSASASQFRSRTDRDGLIDWRWSSTKIENFVRAQTRPYPGAYCHIGNRKIRIFDLRFEEASESRQPGRVEETPEGIYRVLTGDGKWALITDFL